MPDENFDADDFDQTDLDQLSEATPDLRITISPDRLAVMPWFPLMIPRDCPAGNLFRPCEAAGVTIADARAQRTDEPHELTVSYLVHGGGRTAERKLLAWARQVGFARVWLPDRLVEHDTFEMTGRAGCECPSCGADWEDFTPKFWAQVRIDGHFPYCCPLCGGDLPQWSLRGRRSRPVAAARKTAEAETDVEIAWE